MGGEDCLDLYDLYEFYGIILNYLKYFELFEICELFEFMRNIHEKLDLIYGQIFQDENCGKTCGDAQVWSKYFNP